MDKDRIAVSATIAAAVTVVLCVIYVAQHPVASNAPAPTGASGEAKEQQCKGAGCEELRSMDGTVDEEEEEGDDDEVCEMDDPPVGCDQIKQRQKCRETEGCKYTTAKGCQMDDSKPKLAHNCKKKKKGLKVQRRSYHSRKKGKK